MKISVFGKIAAVTVVAAIAVSCKPTEANYKAAYDIAQEARRADEYTSVAGFVREGDPVWRKVGNDSVLVKQQPLARLEGDSLQMRTLNVAIASYGMKANAVAHKNNLSSAGYDARVLLNGDDKYLVIAAQYDSIADLVLFIDGYMKRHKNDMYSGLPGRPVVMIPSGRAVTWE